MNRALLRISLACLVMFVLLLININYVQAFQSSSLAGEPENTRDLQPAVPVPARVDLRHRRRRQHVKIAESRLVKNGGGIYQRFYPDGADLRPGDRLRLDVRQDRHRGGREQDLSGTASSLEPAQLHQPDHREAQARAPRVSLTISPQAQQAAYQALLSDGGHEGGVVAINPSTGAILAMASIPTFNPNAYATLDTAPSSPGQHARQPQPTRTSRC